MHPLSPHLFTLLLLLLVPGFIACAHAHDARPHTSEGDQALRELLAALAPMESIDLEWEPSTLATPNASRARTRVAVHRDGRFAYEEFESANTPHPPRAPGVPVREAAGMPTNQELRYFVYHDLSFIFTTDGDAGLYFKSRAAEAPLSLPPRQQYDLAPWPVLQPIVDRMLQIPQTSIQFIEDRWVARTPLDHGRSFQIEWRVDPTLGPLLTRIQRDAPDARFIADFSRFSLVDGFALPTRRVDDATFQDRGEERHVRTERSLLRVLINPPDIDDRIRFNPASYSMRYVDSATGNVHAREDGPVIYNAHELNAAFAREHAKASLLGRSWFAGLLAATAGSVALFWRKLRGRP